MPVTAPQLQRAFDTTNVAKQQLQQMLVADRGPSWVRMLQAGRQLGAAATPLREAADTVVAAAPSDARVAKAADYLRGSAHHAVAGVEALRGSISGALAGHGELQQQALRILDPASRLAIPDDFNAFETAVKRVDPALLETIGKVSAGRESMVTARSDVEQARHWLRVIAQTTPH